MYLETLGDVIAVRTFYLKDEEPKATHILVKMGKPERFPNSSDFYCPFQICGTGDEKISYAAGIDAFQAIHEAFRKIGMDMYLRINPRLGERLMWEGDEEGDLGFPRFRIESGPAV